MNETIEKAVFQSKWGFHPCSRETLRKLRQLQVYSIHALHQEARLERWERKEPQNRVLNRDKDGLRIPRRQRKTYPTSWPKPVLHSIPFVGDEIENARMPKATADAVKPLRWTEDEINDMLAEARLWFLNHCPHRSR
jgi:hypothetical protein